MNYIAKSFALLIFSVIVSFNAYGQSSTVVVIPMFGDDAAARWRGEWGSGVDYKNGDLVEDFGSSYIATSDHRSDNTNDPQNTFTAWDLVAAKGDKGNKGDQGDTGLLDQETLDLIENILSAVTTTVFITSTTYNGDLVSAANNLTGNTVYTNGILAGDALCQSRADVANLPGTYIAWLSDTNSVSPSSRFNKTTNPYVRVDGAVIANHWNDLTDASIINLINVTENNTAAPSLMTSWTGTEFTGLPTSHACQDWQDGTVDFLGTVGFDTSTSVAIWTNAGPNQCNSEARIYCFEQ